jgi:hypothetical protein
MVTIHEHQTLNPVIFDKVKHMSNLWNWDFDSNTFDMFEYHGDDGDFDQTYDEVVEYTIKGLGKAIVPYEIYHTWTVQCDGGDWYNPPTYDIVCEETDIYVGDIDFDFDINISDRELDDIKNRLEHLIELSLH